MKSMTKKITATALFGVLAVSAFAGCGGANSSSNGSSDAGSDAAKFDASKTISVVTREEGSGTRDAFTELTGVLVKDGDNKTDNTTTSAVTINSTEAVITNVKDNDAAIGYISLGSLNDTVKALKIGGVEATADNVKSGDYAVSRPFNIVTKDGLSADAQDFMDYILSTDGQQVVSDDGYIAIKDTKAYEGSCSGEKVVVAGSSSVTPLMEKLKEAYTKVNSNANIEVQQSDSTTGITSASDGLCDTTDWADVK